MRTLRDFLTVGGIILSAALSAGLLSTGGAFADGAPSGAVADGNALFPLAVGNTWTYRCSAEGSDGFEKTVKLTALVEQGGHRFFRAEMRIRRDPKPLVYFLSTGATGEVSSAFKPDDAAKELLITAAPKSGDRIGDRVAAVGEKMRVPALGQVSVVRVENFSRDDPNVSADRRLEWKGRYYAKGVGPVVEADGLGGECVLSRYKLAGKR